MVDLHEVALQIVVVVVFRHICMFAIPVRILGEILAKLCLETLTRVEVAARRQVLQAYLVIFQHKAWYYVLQKGIIFVKLLQKPALKQGRLGPGKLTSYRGGVNPRMLTLQDSSRHLETTSSTSSLISLSFMPFRPSLSLITPHFA